MITEVIYFLNELDMLEAHLAQHRPWNWRTVIVECGVTVSGVKKPLFFQDNKSRFEKYDVEHYLMPEHLFPVIQGHVDTQYGQFRANDWAKRLWMQANFDPKNPWIFHSDVDEILKEKPVNFDQLDYGYFSAPQYMAQVNRRVSLKVDCWRFARKELTVKQLATPKLNPRRGNVGTNGWHFTNCPSTPEEIRLKAQCRPWYFNAEHPDQVPGVEHFKAMWGQPVNYLTGTQLGDNWLVGLDDLPEWMAANIHLFPVAEK